MKKLLFDYYNWSEFSKFLDGLPIKDAVKLVATITSIEDYGLGIAQRQKWVKKLDSNLFEIRSKRASNIQRAVYFHWEDNRYNITQGFTKKEQKTPAYEISKAKERRCQFERRHPNE